MPLFDKHDDATTPLASPVSGLSRSHSLLYGASVQQQPWWELAAAAADEPSPSVARSNSAKRRLFGQSCDGAPEEPQLPPFLAKPRPSHRQVAATGVALLLFLALCAANDLVSDEASSASRGILHQSRRYLLAGAGEAAVASAAPDVGVAAPASPASNASVAVATVVAAGWEDTQQPLWNVSFTASFLCPRHLEPAAAPVPGAALRAGFLDHLLPAASLLAGSQVAATTVSWQPPAAGDSGSSSRECRAATVSLLLPQQAGLALAAALEADPLLLLGPGSSSKDGREVAAWVSQLCCKAASCDQLDGAEPQLSMLMGCTPGTETQ